MKSLDLEMIKKEINQIITDRDWHQFHSIKNLSMALTRESSELLEIFQWMTEEDSNQIKNRPELKAKLEDEVADVMVYLLRIVDKAEIDLEKAILNKLQKNREKYPVDKSRGNSKKYTEF